MCIKNKRFIYYFIHTMCMNLTKKDIISINKNFALGHFENESSLNFALEHSKYEIAWTKQLAYLIRAVLIDHVFVDGNKRTAYGLLLNYVSLNKWSIEEKQATELSKLIALSRQFHILNALVQSSSLIHSQNG